MTTIHELAHLLLKLPEGIEAKEEEKLVGRFAGAFLLPADSFRDQFGKHRSVITLEELIQLKIFYGVLGEFRQTAPLKIAVDSEAP